MGGRSAPDDVEPWPVQAPPSPSLAAAATLAAILFLALVCNGRPISAGDTRPTEHVAASLVEQRNLDLDEYPELEPPFVRAEGAHRVSIYPVLSAVLAAPVFAAARAVFALDDTGTAFAGKLAAALFSALAAGFVFLAVGTRRSEAEAAWTAVLFALGTSVWSTSQALWQHPAAVLFLSIAIFFLVKAEHEPVWAGRAGLPLALAVAARHADVALVGVLTLAIAGRWPRRIPFLAAWALPAGAFVVGYQWLYFGSPLRHGFSGSLGRFSEPWGVGHAGLLISPAKGLVVFTPLVIVAAIGLVVAARRGDAFLALSLGAAAVAHWALLGRWSEWHGGESFGPRMMTDALPPLFLFLPEGFGLLQVLALPLAVFSVAVQAWGAFGYDYRWERLHRPLSPNLGELWSISDSPLLLAARERVAILAAPAVKDGRLTIRESSTVLFGPTGSRLAFAGGRLRLGGSEPTFGDVHLLTAARLDDDKLRMKGRWDGLFLRVLPAARARPLELRIVGHGRGLLYVGEKTFWTEPRWTTYPMNGVVHVRHPYEYATSGGGDLVISVGKSGGEAAFDAVALVPPSEPDTVIQLGGS